MLLFMFALAYNKDVFILISAGTQQGRKGLNVLQLPTTEEPMVRCFTCKFMHAI